MFKSNIIFVLLFSFSFSCFANVDTTALERLNNFFIGKNYRQAKQTKRLLSQVKSSKSLKFKMAQTQKLYTQIKANKRFAPKVKTYVLKEIKTFYKTLKSTKTPAVVTKPIAKSNAIVTKTVDNKPIKLRPLKVTIPKPKINKLPPKPARVMANSKPLSVFDTFYDGYIIFLNFAVFGLFAFVSIMLWKKNRNLKGQFSKEQLVSTASADTALNENFVSSLVRLSSSVLPGNYYVFYDFSGKITRFSGNVKSLVAGNIKAGMKWNDIIDRHFHEIGEGQSKYFISLHNTERFFTMNSKSIESLGLNVAQFVEVERDMVTQSREYQDNYYLENPCGLVDLFENSLVEASSFRQDNLVENIFIESKGNDVSFQAEADINELFQGVSQVIRVIHEQEQPEISVKFDTFKRNHILDIRFDGFAFSSFQDPDNVAVVERIEDIKVALENLGGSIVVKNLQTVQQAGMIQIIFEQVIQRDLTIEEEFDIQTL